MKKTEFELAVGAKAGNQEDLMTLWSMYKNVCMGILYKVAHLENAELESEAFIVFHDKFKLAENLALLLPAVGFYCFNRSLSAWLRLGLCGFGLF